MLGLGNGSRACAPAVPTVANVCQAKGSDEPASTAVEQTFDKATQGRRRRCRLRNLLDERRKRGPDRLPLYPSSPFCPFPACISSQDLLHFVISYRACFGEGYAALVVSFLKSEPRSRGTQMHASTDTIYKPWSEISAPHRACLEDGGRGMSTRTGNSRDETTRTGLKRPANDCHRRGPQTLLPAPVTRVNVREGDRTERSAWHAHARREHVERGEGKHSRASVDPATCGV